MKSTYSFALLIAASLVTTQFAAAADSMTPTRTVPVEEEVFFAHETSIDIFGSVSLNEEKFNRITNNRLRKDGRLGAGGGINYFFTRYVGIGGDAFSESANHTFIDNASASLILRLPIDSIRLAPYIFAGGGYQFETADRAFAQAGGGVEFRFTKGFGVFTDARFIVINNAKDFGVGRAGIRFSF